MLKSLGAYVGEETLFAYDANGNAISVTDPLANVTGSAFDALNRLATVTDALLNDASYTYDAAGNRETATDQRGLVTSYVHDGFGQVIQQSSPDTGVTVFTHDSAGNMITRTDARGVITERTYDVLARPTAMNFPAAPAENVTYTYDNSTPGHYGLGRAASVTDDSGSTAYRYDARENIVRVESIVGAQTYITEYGYDFADRLVQIVYPSGRIVDYARDAIGRVISVTTKASSGGTPVALATGLTYEAMGGINGMVYGNGVTLALDRDLNGQLAAIDAFNGGAPILDLNYTFDLAGNITYIDDIGLGNRGRNYAYDNLYRLTQAQELASGGGSVTLQTDYTYDAVGNRLTRNAGGALETYAYDPFSNRLDTVTAGATVRTLGYSASGNTDGDDNGLGTALTNLYDSTDRLSEVKQDVTTAATNLHNTIGQRVAKTVGAATTHYAYDLGGNLIAEADGGTGTAQAEYVWLGGMPLAYIVSGAVYSIHADHLNTPQRLTAADGSVAWDADYRPFGEAAVTGTLTFNLRFPGQYADAETGLYYNGFRDYDPAIGRYIQSDPIGLGGGWNSYAYVGGNPVTRLDMRGLKVSGSWLQSPYLSGGGVEGISVDNLGENYYVDAFGFLNILRVHITLQGAVSFSVFCVDDGECGAKRTWTVDGNVSVTHSTQFDLGISLPAIAGAMGAGMVPGMAPFIPLYYTALQTAAVSARMAYKLDAATEKWGNKVRNYKRNILQNGPTAICLGTSVL